MSTATSPTPDALAQRLADSGLRSTPQREVIYDVLLKKRDHPTADEVYARVRADMPTISLATVAVPFMPSAFAASPRTICPDRDGMLRVRDKREFILGLYQVPKHEGALREASEAGHAIADATADARITGAIKTKLLASRDLSALNISVNTTTGVVTLSGTVASPEHISKAILLAMETSGVREVVSTLQVKPKAK